MLRKEICIVLVDDDEIEIKYKRGKIISKHCSASALSDNQNSINSLTLSAAKKQGLTKNTNVVAFCDGAKNCWNINFCTFAFIWLDIVYS